MMSLLISGVGELVTNGEGGNRSQAAVVVEDGKVAWVGEGAHAPAADEHFDAEGRALLPGWVDSHTHMVFGGDRTGEFTARMAGQAYAAGGIQRTVAATREASDVALRRNLDALADEALRSGTTAFETKTGYGLTTHDEVRLAKIAGTRADAVTFLGAHVVPTGMDAAAYVDVVCGDMLDAVAPYVGAIDVFCETGAFDEDASRRILQAGRAAGLALRVHGNQLGEGPGVALAVELGAASVDHVTFVTDSDVDALAGSWLGGRGTVATVLPACDLSTKMPLAPARRLLDAGITVAIATNANPGSSYTTSMAFCVATAVLQMGLSVDEAVRAATLGGAIALGLDAPERGGLGRIVPGSRADLHLLEAPSATHLAYRPGVPLTAAVWRAGERVV